MKRKGEEGETKEINHSFRRELGLLTQSSTLPALSLSR